MGIDLDKLLRDAQAGIVPKMSDDSAVWSSFTYDHVLPRLPKSGDLKQLSIFLAHIFSSYGLKEEDIATTMAMAAHVTPVLDQLADDIAKKIN